MIARQLPNTITLARIALALPLGMTIRSGEFGWALGLAALAAVSDLADGYLARRYGWQTALGRSLDPLADKLLLGVCFLALWSAGFVPAWLLLLVLGRDMLIVAGAVLYHRLIGPVVAQPTRLGKLGTAMQLGLVLLWLLHLAGLGLPATVLQYAGIAVAVVTVASGIDYVWRWGARALSAGRRSGR